MLHFLRRRFMAFYPNKLRAEPNSIIFVWLKYNKKMTKRYTLWHTLVLAIFSMASTYGQFPMMGQGQSPKITGKISGMVTDSSSSTAIEFAAVSIKKTGAKTELNGTITDSKGLFKFDEIAVGKYDITISFLGYQDKTISIETDGKKPDLNLGAVMLSPSNLLLTEVVIEGEAALIENKVDRLVYNAEKDISIAGGDASDVLRKVPLLSVDIDGNPSLRGSTNVRVLINGKPTGTMAGSIADALKMIPAEEIKTIEVITSPSAKYDAEGTGGLINIITKKRTIEGVNASVNTGINTRNISLNGNAGWKKRRLSLNGSLGGNYFIPQGGFTEFERVDQTPAGDRIFTQDGEFIGGRNTYNGTFSADYDINAYHNISSSVRVNNFSFFGDNIVDVNFIDPAIPLNQLYSRSSISRNGTTNVDWSIDYKRSYDTKGKEFTASAQISRGISLNRFTVEQSAELFPDIILAERSRNTGLNTEFTFQADYVHPLKAGNIETGAKGILRNINSRFNYEVKDFTSDTYFEDEARSNRFVYDQNVGAGYLSYNHRFNKNYETKAGIRYEYTDIVGEFEDENGGIVNQFHNFVPNFTLVRNLKNFRSLKLTYSRRIQRPSLFFLNPFTDQSDPRNIRRGNPDLQPEESDQVEIGYNGFFKNVVLNTTLYYRNTRDVIQSYLFIDSNGVSVNTFGNIGTNNSVGVNLFGQITLFSDWVIRGSFNGFYIVQEGRIVDDVLRNDDFQYNIFLNSTYQLKNGYAFEMFGVFNSQRVTLQGRNPAFSIHNISFKKDLWKKKGSIGINLTNPFARYLKFRQDLTGSDFRQSFTNAIPIQALGVNFSYRFGKTEFRNPMQPRKKGVNNQDLKNEEGGFNF
jgi:ferric enterobactin receptor